MILLIEYFKHENEERHNEYLTCLKENIENDLITKIEIFISDDSICHIDSDKININNIDSRPTYKYFFDFCNENHSNKICIVSNSDIIFNETLDNINDSNIENKFIALTRWDIIEDGKLKFFNREDSQDCWIFKSPINLKTNHNFHLGKPGCDNRIVHIARESGLILCNPSKRIITKHLHLTNLRNYNSSDAITGDYFWLEPTSEIEKCIIYYVKLENNKHTIDKKPITQ